MPRIAALFIMMPLLALYSNCLGILGGLYLVVSYADPASVLVGQNADLLLKPEMFTNVTISNTTDQQAVCIPTTALVEENSQTFVVLYNNNCDLKVAQVEILKKTGEKAFIKSGVASGQKLLTHNALLLYDEFTDNQK